MLEPDRRAGEAAFTVRTDGDYLALSVGEYFRVDLHDFTRLRKAAAEAEADAMPSVALEHLESALALVRGPFDWDDGELAATGTRTRDEIVTTACRAGELLFGAGRPDDALARIEQALGVDPWSDRAHRLAVSIAWDNGDADRAFAASQRCLRALEALGVAPSPATMQVLARIRAR